MPAAEGYGKIDAKKTVKIRRHRSIPRQREVSLARFKHYAKGKPVEGKRYSLRGVTWPIKVLKVGKERVLLELIPEKETRIPALIGRTRVTYDEKSVTTTIVTNARVGDKLTTNNGQHAKVVALDEKNITLDLNHPLAGKRVTFDFTTESGTPLSF